MMATAAVKAYSQERSLSLQFPEKLQILFVPRRYKILKGGRGGAKSWGVARALLLQGASEPLRILCTREIQKSIKESVHQLLKDQIEMMDLSYFYTVYDNVIRGMNGTEFHFAGLGHQTTDSIKSFEGYQRVWVEEGQSVRKRSWDILIPTIRRLGSEIWVTFNPDLETDDTYVRFVKNTPPNCIVIDINYYDNPWFPEILEQERLHCKATEEEDTYNNIWEGYCRSAVEGAIFHKQIAEAIAENRITRVPYDPMLKVHIVCDYGRLDSMSIGLIQRNASEIRMIGEIHGGHSDLKGYSQELKLMALNWGRWWLPHDAFAKRVETGTSGQEILTALGWDCPDRSEITEESVENGIKYAQTQFHRLYVDEESCPYFIEACKRYRRRINRETNWPSTPLADEWAHGADMGRYLFLNADSMKNENPGTRKIRRVRRPVNWRAR